MPILVRKIAKAKWKAYTTIEEDKIVEIPADAITVCLKTTQNALSVWEINSAEDINEAALALASNFDSLSSTDLVLLDKDLLTKQNIEYKNTPENGNIKIDDLTNTHYDLIELTYSKLGKLSNLIAEQINTEKVRRYTIREIREILVDAISRNRLRIEDLKPSVRDEVRKFLSH